MPTKHIEPESWDRISSLAVEGTSLTQQMIKETEVLKLVIERGLGVTSIDDVKDLATFTPSFKTLCWKAHKNGLPRAAQAETVSELLDALSHADGVLIVVYGKTNSGRTTFATNLLKQCNSDVGDLLFVDDIDAKKGLFQTAVARYLAGERVIVTLHAVSEAVVTKLFWDEVAEIMQPQFCN